VKKFFKAFGGTLGYLCLIAAAVVLSFYLVIGSFGLLIPVLILAVIAVPFLFMARNIAQSSGRGEKH
jgi:uncharacterized PurR-regulated membrane protein YhhQ (DUF165 family)